ncbi:MAG: hypothetical protein AAF830_00120 [Pseudomonadota bacterium]
MIRTAVLILLLFVSACGFKPLYATGDGPEETAALNQVRLGAVRGPTVSRDIMRTELGDTFRSTSGDERYLLSVNLRETTRAISVTVESNVRRFNYQLTANIAYADKETGEQRRQNLQSVVSYAVVPSQYATLVGQEDAKRRAVIDLVRKIETDAALYVQGRPTAESQGSIFRGNNQRDPLSNLERKEEERAREAAEEAETEDTEVDPDAPVTIPNL